MPQLLPAGYTVHHGSSAFAALRQEWNLLLARSSFNSVFLTWEWQTAWWECLGTGELTIVAFHNADNKLIGIAPLFSTQTGGSCQLQLVGCSEVADYLDIIIAAGSEPEVYSGFLRFLTGSAAPAWDSVRLCNLHESSLSHRLLPELARSAGLQAKVEEDEVAPYLPLPATFDAYLEGLDKKQRHELRRKLSKIDREVSNWRWFQVRDQADMLAWVDRFIELHRLASANKNEFMSGQMPAFFHRLARAMAEEGWLQLAFIEIDGQLAAALFNFDYAGRIWVYNSGFNPQIYTTLSPGIVLNAHLIAHAIESGHRVYDFLRGDEIYKYRFGAVDASVMSVELSR